jgi:hypothetical protein
VASTQSDIPDRRTYGQDKLKALEKQDNFPGSGRIILRPPFPPKDDVNRLSTVSTAPDRAQPNFNIDSSFGFASPILRGEKVTAA